MIALPTYLIKLNARMSLRKNYWKAVFCAVLTFLGTLFFSFTERKVGIFSIRDFVTMIFSAGYNFTFKQLAYLIYLYLSVRAATYFFNLVLLNPISLIGYNFYNDNSKEYNKTLYLKDYVREVKEHYLNYFMTMLLKTAILFLYTFMLILPVFYKYYSYKMVPYILAHRPDLKPMEVLKESERLMKGNRFKCFLYDVSFAGWYLVSLLSGFVLYFLYVRPYYLALYAEVYDALYAEKGTYGLKYADNERYHPTKFTVRRKGLLLGILSGLLYILADFCLYWGSHSGNPIGLVVETGWENIKAMTLVASIFLACAATPFFYQGIKQIIQIVSEHIGPSYSETGAMQKYFEYSAIFSTITILLVHLILCIYPILYKILILQMPIREAATLVNHFALYLIIPQIVFFILPMFGISVVYIYMIITKRIEIPAHAMLAAPLVSYLLVEVLIHQIPNPLIKDITECGQSLGWTLFMLAFLLYNEKARKKATSKEMEEVMD